MTDALTLIIAKLRFYKKYHKGYGTQIDYVLWIKLLGVDFQVKTIRVDERNIAIQLWDTAGN